VIQQFQSISMDQVTNESDLLADNRRVIRLNTCMYHALSHHATHLDVLVAIYLSTRTICDRFRFNFRVIGYGIDQNRATLWTHVMHRCPVGSWFRRCIRVIYFRCKRRPVVLCENFCNRDKHRFVITSSLLHVMKATLIA
jgi:hypothetical protein